MQIPVQVISLVSAIVGGLIASSLTHVYTFRRWRREKLLDRLEEIHAHCQALYEGHKARLDVLASRSVLGQPDNWPKHPGSDSSAMKMKISIYAPKLKPEMLKIDEVHQNMKAHYAELTDLASTGGSTVATPALTFASLEKDLEKLGRRCAALKRAVENEASVLLSVKRPPELPDN